VALQRQGLGAQRCSGPQNVPAALRAPSSTQCASFTLRPPYEISCEAKRKAFRLRACNRSDAGSQPDSLIWGLGKTRVKSHHIKQ